MKILELIRLEESEQGTIGVLKIDKTVYCYTLEPPDYLNQINKSSIPTGQYLVMPHESARFKNTWQITGVPGRTDILFHPGNTSDDTNGCVILGQHVGYLKRNRAVLNSGYTFRRFLEIMQGEEVAHLTITESY